MYKKYLFVSFVLFAGIVSFLCYRKMEMKAATSDLSRSTIRFHVLANSDSSIDQNLKMNVKEQVVNYIYEHTKECKTVNDTLNYLKSNDSTIKQIAQREVNNQGFHYLVTTSLSEKTFPQKIYGDVSFPKGSYTSYTITIGNGKGHNWWCVLYPPLCFVDASTGIVPDSSKEQLQETLNNHQYHSIIQFRFKYLTFLNNFLE